MGEHATTGTLRRVGPAKERVTHAELFRFYFPLAIQAASQSFTYPLVAAVASRGPGGPVNMAGLAQSNAILGLLGTLGAGLVTAGLVYARTREGYARFKQVNYLITAAVILLQALLCLPPLSHLWFHTLMGLPASIEQPAHVSLIASLALQVLFFLRNPYQVCLYTHNATRLASQATIGRIVLTVLLVPVAVALGLVGPVWAVVVQAIAVACEVLFSWYFARPYLRELPAATSAPPTIRELTGFVFPLSVGGLFLSISGILVAGMMAQAPDPERMLQAYYLASGLAGPAASAAGRVQPVAIMYLSRVRRERMLLIFTLLVGLLMGGIPLLFILPGLADMYYTSLQKCPPDIFLLVRISAIGLLFHPLTVAFRAYYEGKAALLKKPSVILTGQVVYFAALTGIALVCIRLSVSGNLLAPISFFVANIVSAVMVYYAINRKERVI